MFHYLVFLLHAMCLSPCDDIWSDLFQENDQSYHIIFLLVEIPSEFIP
jgi:hypothetical protein